MGRFIPYLQTRTDAPPDFHIHAGMTALSVALGNRVWCDGPGRELYPNLWMVVIAPSGYGKSVPLDLSQDLVEQAGLGGHILPGSFSQEALMGALRSQPIGVWYLQEFAGFLGVLGRDYNQGAMEWLTELYDVPRVTRRVVKGGAFQLERPYITILGASSPAWFAEQYRRSMLAGGFLARFLFIPSSAAGADVGQPGPRDQRTENDLATHLVKVRQLKGKADFSAVRDRLNEWSASQRQLARAQAPEFSGMRSRAPAIAQKAAMLFRVSADPGSLAITPADLDNAIQYVERCHALAERFLSDEVPHDRADADRIRILEAIRRNGGELAWSAALRNLHLSADALGRAVRTLAESEELRVEKRGGSGRFLVLNMGLRALSA